ncbi:MAG: methyltransferase domain-containing protein [Pseudomonadota bacterium]
MPETAQCFVETYDQIILHPKVREEYGAGAYYNVGDWTAAGEGAGQEAASRALVARHIALAALDRPGLAVVDVGCGLGQSTADLVAARPDASVVGVNLSTAQLAAAHARFPDLSFAAMDAAVLPLAPASVDRVIAVEAVFHFNSRAAFLKAAARSLVPGGLMVFTDVLFTEDSAPWDWWVPEINRGQRLDDYAQFLADCGLTARMIEDITPFTWTPYCAHLRESGRESADRIEPWVAHYLMVVAEPCSSKID